MGWNRWPRESDRKPIKWTVFIIIFFFVVLISVHDKNITWENDNNFIIWSGTYFEAITYSEIDSLGLEDKLPNLKSKSNGYAAFGRKKGNFIRRRDNENCLLYTSDAADD